MSDFGGKIAVITGGASGIGLAIARKLVALGGSVVLGDINADRLAQAANEFGDSALPVACDTADLASLEAFADAAFSWQGRVDLLLNNAGVNGPRGKLWEVDAETARAHFDVNYWGVWNGCKVFAPRLIAQDHASAIYNTGSENSFFCAVPHSGTYIAAKHAVLGLTESLREDLPAHVHAGLIIPGWVFTGIGEERFMKFGMEADDFADIVVPQILDRARFVVSHSYNPVRINERIDAVNAAFAQYAPRRAGDEEHDVRTVIAALTPKKP